MPGTAFRTVALEDAPELLAIYSYYVQKTAITFEWETPSLEEFERRISATLERYPYIVVLLDGKITGYAYVGPFHARRAYDWAVETSIYLDCTARGRGLGKSLYQKLEEILRRMGILNMYACVASPKKDGPYLTSASEGFHARLGFRTVGRFNECGFKFNEWFDMVWMEKTLGPHIARPQDVIPFPELRPALAGTLLLS